MGPEASSTTPGLRAPESQKAARGLQALVSPDWTPCPLCQTSVGESGRMGEPRRLGLCSSMDMQRPTEGLAAKRPFDERGRVQRKQKLGLVDRSEGKLERGGENSSTNRVVAKATEGPQRAGQREESHGEAVGRGPSRNGAALAPRSLCRAAWAPRRRSDPPKGLAADCGVLRALEGKTEGAEGLAEAWRSSTPSSPCSLPPVSGGNAAA